MWTDITRGQYRRDKLTYASVLMSKEWEVLGPILPGPSSRGRPRRVELQSVVEAIFYVLESGCQWRMLPDSFPPRSTVQRYFYTWCRDGTWKQINRLLLMRAREEMGREASPGAGVIDSQSVRTTEAGSVRRHDAGKKVKGRKRHIVTDTNGLLVGVVVHGTDIQDRDSAPLVLASIRTAFPWLRHVFADGGYAGDKLKTSLAAIGEWTVEIIKRSDTAQGFVVLPKRWVVERTFAWLGRNRRLAKDFEKRADTAMAWIFAASIKLITRRQERKGKAIILPIRL
ncbi:IS5 family transposase [Pararhodospirillum oryzae]|uniref:IS5 family transposase n=1 Tax=Pararhodospirillum oryzae TaxID=478448 RepID=A0A512H4Y2_9PROT|nr:IS5 family transposase [Pararhodospirillum oryzae]GEO80497.1 IS5 family transposase [Pararhodospirillum oryzae]